MNHPLGKLRQEALLLQLSTTEKEALHAAIMQKVRGSEKADTTAGSLGTPSFYFSFFTPRFAPVFAALLLVLVGGGTAFAAKGALPGDPLYTIKTKVNEPIEGALALSTEAKIKFHGEVAQTRLEEAEVLASQNRLSTEATAGLESDINSHLSQVSTLAASLDEKTPGASASVAGELNYSIAAHGQVLAALGFESSSSTTRQNSDTLATRARAANISNGRGGQVVLAMAAKMATPAAPSANAPQPMAMMAMNVRMENQDAASSTPASSSEASDPKAGANAAPSREEKAALKLEAHASSSLDALMRSAASARAHVSADVQAKLDARLSRIASLIADGRASIDAGNFDDASDSFDAALDRSVTLSTFIAANTRFDSGILGNLLDHDEEGGE